MYTVYMHTSPDGKRYVGMTAKTPEQRWRNKYHNNEKFSKAIKKYGWNNFSHDVLFENLSKEDAEKIEKALIKKYDTANPAKGYNIALGGHGNSGYHHSEETKSKIRKSLTGIQHTDERKAKQSAATRNKWRNPEYRLQMVAAHIGKNRGKDNATSKRIRQLSLTGEIIKEFDALADAERELGINHRMISDCCRGRQKTCKGFKWEYA